MALGQPRLPPRRSTAPSEAVLRAPAGSFFQKVASFPFVYASVLLVLATPSLTYPSAPKDPERPRQRSTLCSALLVSAGTGSSIPEPNCCSFLRTQLDHRALVAARAITGLVLDQTSVPASEPSSPPGLVLPGAVGAHFQQRIQRSPVLERILLSRFNENFPTLDF